MPNAVALARGDQPESLLRRVTCSRLLFSQSQDVYASTGIDRFDASARRCVLRRSNS